jgi:hypothetical protein
MFGKAPTRMVVTFPCAHPEVDSPSTNTERGTSLCSARKYFSTIFIVGNYPINIIKLIDIINVEDKANDVPLTEVSCLSNGSLNQQFREKATFRGNAHVQVVAVFLPHAAWLLWRIRVNVR